MVGICPYTQVIVGYDVIVARGAFVQGHAEHRFTVLHFLTRYRTPGYCSAHGEYCDSLKLLLVSSCKSEAKVELVKLRVLDC